MMDLSPRVSTLVSPLPGDSPCGPDMLFSPEYDELQELRREDDATLSQGEWVTDLKRADWPTVLKLSERLLLQHTKDLRLAAWWAEAATRVDGYNGLADGLYLYAVLSQDHWDHVQPLPEQGDQELRIGSLTWLITQAKNWLRSVPLLRHGEQTIHLADIEAARQRASTASENPAGNPPRDGQPAPITADVVQRAQRSTPAAQVRAALDGVRRVPAAVQALQTVMDERLGQDGPGFAPLRDAAQAARDGVERLARDMGLLGTTNNSSNSATDSPAPSAAHAPVEAVAATGPGGAPTSRTQAIAQLRMVAEFFRRTEPHSPVAYLADRAAHWGEMPLHEWLRTVLKEQSTLSQLEELLGVQPEASRSE